MTRPAPLMLTTAAIDRIKVLMDMRGKPSAGIRIAIKTKGCSGLAYSLEYVDEQNPLDERLDVEGLTVFIEPKATLYILGTEMDFVSDEIQSGFVFRNPNEKGRCGCGESFHV